MIFVSLGVTVLLKSVHNTPGDIGNEVATPKVNQVNAIPQ